MFSKSNLPGERFQKIILIFLFLSFTFALIVTWLNPATDFEPSIYSSTPPVLWIVLLPGVFFSISLIVLSFSGPEFGRRRLWKFGLLFIILGYITMLCLPIIRGYFGWCMDGDPATHIELATRIIRTGHMSSDLIYPALHIFISEISLVTSLSPLSLHKIIPAFFGMLFPLFIYLMVRSLDSDTVTPIIAGGIICCPFIFNNYTNLTPNGMADMFIPLVFFLMIKYLHETNIGWGMLLCIILILYPVFHPLPSIVIGIVLITLWISPAFRDVWNGFRENNRNFPNLIRRNFNGKVVIPFLVLSIWFIFWFSTFRLWGKTIGDMILTIAREGRGPSSLTSLTSQITYAQGYGYNVLDVFLRTWGGAFFIFCLSVIAFPVLWQMISREKKEDTFSLYGPWVVVGSIIPVVFLFNLNFGPLRFVSYISILGTAFVAALMSYLIMKGRNSEKRGISLSISIFVIVVLFLLFLNSWGSMYPSRSSYTQNFQTTEAKVVAITKFFEYRNVSVPLISLSGSIFRYEHLLLLPEHRLRQNLPDFGDVPLPPWHYGYDKYPSIAFSYGNETNLFFEMRDLVMYRDYYPEMAKYRFYPEDFIRIKNDPGASLVYSDGDEFDIYVIKGQSYHNPV